MIGRNGRVRHVAGHEMIVFRDDRIADSVLARVGHLRADPTSAPVVVVLRIQNVGIDIQVVGRPPLEGGVHGRFLSALHPALIPDIVHIVDVLVRGIRQRPTGGYRDVGSPVAVRIDAVLRDRSILIRGTQEDAELVVTEGTAQDARCARALVSVEVVVGALHARAAPQAVVVERLARHDVDRPAERTVGHVGGQQLRHSDRADDLRREVVEESRVRAATFCADQRAAVDLRAVLADASDRHVYAFTGLAFELDARHARERLCDVVVGQLADVLRDDCIDERIGLPLLVECVPQATRDADDDDFIHDGGLLILRRRVRCNECRERHRDLALLEAALGLLGCLFH